MKVLLFTVALFSLTTFGAFTSHNERGANSDRSDGPYKYAYTTCNCAPNGGEKKERYLFIGVVQTRSAGRIKNSFYRQLKNDYKGWASIGEDIVVDAENSFQKAKDHRLGIIAKYKSDNYKIENVKLTQGRNSSD